MVKYKWPGMCGEIAIRNVDIKERKNWAITNAESSRARRRRSGFWMEAAGSISHSKKFKFENDAFCVFTGFIFLCLISSLGESVILLLINFIAQKR